MFNVVTVKSNMSSKFVFTFLVKSSSWRYFITAVEYNVLISQNYITFLLGCKSFINADTFQNTSCFSASEVVVSQNTNPALRRLK